MSARALRRVNCDLTWNDAFVEQRRRDLGQAFVPHRDCRDNALVFILLDQFEIGGDFLGGKRQRLFNLNPHHLRKFRRIDSRQSKTLRENSRHRQTQHELVLRRNKRHCFIEGLEQAHVPLPVSIAGAEQIPAVRSRRNKNR